VRHWLVAGTRATAYTGDTDSENQLRRDIVDRTVVDAPDGVEMGAESPLGEPWKLYDPGYNIFVEDSSFYFELSALDLYGATDVVSPVEAAAPARFWACGTADLWVNGVHVCRHDVPKYMYPEPVSVSLPLAQGRNRVCVRLQALGVRDTRFLFGLQMLADADGLEVWLPGDDGVTESAAQVEEWLNSVRAMGRDTLLAGAPAPVAGSVRLQRGTAVEWPQDAVQVTFEAAGVSSPVLEVTYEGQSLRRAFDIPGNRIISPSTASSSEAHRREVTEHMAQSERRGRGGVMAALSRHVLGRRSPEDTSVLFEALDWIDGRPDCADFPLSAMLRLYQGDTLTEEERERIKQTVLGFRYWPDEPGSDAMCFDSENHSLLFHGSQLIAGNLFPDEVFTNSGRTGREQADIGRARCTQWLDTVEETGYREFLSSTYMPLTAGALLNLVDFSGDPEISRRASAQVDEIFRMLAMQSFDGVTVGPQGRVYRGVLYPDSSGTQAMLSYAAPEAMVAYNDWLSFAAASANYRLPEGLPAEIRKPVSKRYRQAGVEILVEKTGDYLVTSLQIPASFQKPLAKGEPPYASKGLVPGRQGYQQHLWHATLGRECHVFVNHPGESFDMGHARPGFWYGNGAIPRTAQRGPLVLQIYDVYEDHPIPFTHAHWPADVFDRQAVEDQWAFGEKDTGFVGLWCSAPLILRSEVLSDRELRAQGRRSAWVCLCGGREDASGLSAFADRCKQLRPVFHADKLELELEGAEGLRYGE